MSAAVIAVTIRKGGTGKTTTAAALAQAAAYTGRRVLAIDLDSQGNLSQALGVRATADRNAYLLMMHTRPAAETVIESKQGLNVIPAAIDLATVPDTTGAARRLQSALEPIRADYDLIVIDTPAAGILQYNALQAATAAVFPVHADSYGIQSIYQITDVTRQFMRTNPALTFAGVLLASYDGRPKHARAIRDAIRSQAEALGVSYIGEVRRGVAIQEAATLQRSLYEYAPNSKPAADYLQALQFIMEEGQT